MRHICFLVLLLLFINTNTISQTMKIMTYNVENLFDTQHDEGKNDYDILFYVLSPFAQGAADWRSG